jgi:hypothetical protein
MSEEKISSESHDEVMPELDVNSQDQLQSDDDDSSSDKDGQDSVQGKIGESGSASVSAQAHGNIPGTNVGDSVGGKVGVYEEAQAGGHASIGKHGVSIGGGAIAGDGVDASASGGVHIGRSKVKLTTSVSIGDQIGATASCQSTVKDGVLHTCVKGEVAAGLGLKGDVCIDIDTRAVDDDGKTFVKTCSDLYDETFGKIKI